MPNDTTVKFKADISQLKAAMQQASRAIKVANSEFKASTAGMDKWSSSAQGLQAKLKQLNSVLKAQKTQLSLAEQELEKTKAVYGENSAATDRARIKVNNYKAAIAKTEKDLNKYEKELEDVTKESKDMANAVDDSAEAAERAKEGFTVMKGALASLVADGIRVAIRAVKELATETFNAGANFESAMSQVEAVSGASAEEMDALTAKAKEMGESTKFSATESAEAFNYMAMAGWKTEEMIDGIGGIMNLAAASGADLATTSDIVTDALTAMGYGAEDAGKLADVMAAASSNANTNVEMMGATFQYAAPLVGALGYNMEDTAVAIGLMANAGIKGEKAGTALRSIFTRLSSPPKAAAEAMEKLGISLTDSSGKMKPFAKVMEDLRGKFKGLDETQQTQMASALAGQEAMSGLLAIVNASPSDFKKLTKAVKESEGAAQDMADTMNDNVSGQITLLKSKIEGIMIKVFEKAAPKIRNAIDSISNALDSVDWDSVANRVSQAVKQVVDVFKWLLQNGSGVASTLKVIAGLLTTMFVVNKIATFKNNLTTLVPALLNAQKATEGATLATKALGLAQAALPWAALAAGVAALAGGISLYAKAQANAIKEANGLTEEEKKHVNALEELTTKYDELEQSRSEATATATAEFDYLSSLKKEYNSLVDSKGKIKKADQDRANFIKGELANALGLEQSEIDKLIGKNGKFKKSIDDVIQAQKAQAVLEANKDAYQNAIQYQQKGVSEYAAALQTLKQKQEEYAASSEVLAQKEQQLQNLQQIGGDKTGSFARQVEKLRIANEGQKAALDETKKAVEDYKNKYVEASTTIANYEGLAAAIKDGDAQKINAALSNITYNFKTAQTATKSILEQQLKDAQTTYNNLKAAVELGAEGVTQAQVNEAKKLVDMSKAELDKLAPEAKKSGQKAGSDYAKGVGSKSGSAKKSGEKVGKAAASGAKAGAKNAKKTGQTAGQDYAKGVESAKAKSKKAGQNVAKAGDDAVKKSAKESKKTGQTAGDEYAKGVESKKGAAQNAGKSLGSGTKTGAATVKGLPLGQEFGQGYVNGIRQYINPAYLAGADLATQANKGARSKKGQDSHSPSKLTFKTGKEFTQGYINGIVSLQSGLVKTVQGMVKTVVSELGNMSGLNFSEVATNASTKFADTMGKQVDYMLARIQYNNENRIKNFDSTISDLQAKQKKKEDLQSKITKAKNRIKTLQNKKKQTEADKKELKQQQASLKKYQNALNKSYNKNYNSLIKTQEKYKEAYQTASQQMLSEFQSAVNSYQSAAQKLIDDTINGITETYTARYDELINKQDTLIQKLTGAADLFEVSGAGVMTVNDIKEQTKQIKDYTNKLAKIKEKVSSELFDQIATYDMKEGSAFIDRLLAMSAADLDAYNEAYTEKMQAASEAAQNIYKSDFDQVANDYEKEINSAFKGIDKQLKELGNQAMKGFIDGLTKNTDYMDKNVKTFVSSMIDTFKKELKISSPSKVMFGIGEFTGEGFDNGLLSVVKQIQATARQIASAVSSPLDGVTADIGGVRSSVAQGGYNGAYGTNNNVVNNNYSLVQNNTSPRALTALETYRARRQQIAMMKAATQNG